jgi:hypothetical protein
MSIEELDVRKLVQLVEFADKMAATIAASTTSTPEDDDLVFKYLLFKEGAFDDVSGEGEAPVVQSVPLPEPSEQEDPEVSPDPEVVDGVRDVLPDGSGQD